MVEKYKPQENQGSIRKDLVNLLQPWDRGEEQETLLTDEQNP